MNLLYDTTSKLLNINQHPPQPSLKREGAIRTPNVQPSFPRGKAGMGASP